MAKPVRRLNLENEPAPVRTFLERIHAEGSDVVIERSGRPLLKIVEPAATGETKDISPQLPPEQRAARLRALFGAWRDVDADALKSYISEGRRLDARPPVDL